MIGVLKNPHHKFSLFFLTTLNNFFIFISYTSYYFTNKIYSNPKILFVFCAFISAEFTIINVFQSNDLVVFWTRLHKTDSHCLVNSLLNNLLSLSLKSVIIVSYAILAPPRIFEQLHHRFFFNFWLFQYFSILPEIESDLPPNPVLFPKFLNLKIKPAIIANNIISYIQNCNSTSI